MRQARAGLDLSAFEQFRQESPNGGAKWFEERRWCNVPASEGDRDGHSPRLWLDASRGGGGKLGLSDGSGGLCSGRGSGGVGLRLGLREQGGGCSRSESWKPKSCPFMFLTIDGLEMVFFFKRKNNLEGSTV